MMLLLVMGEVLVCLNSFSATRSKFHQCACLCMGSMQVTLWRVLGFIPFSSLYEQHFREDEWIHLQSHLWCISPSHSWVNCLLNRWNGPGCFLGLVASFNICAPSQEMPSSSWHFEGRFWRKASASRIEMGIRIVIFTKNIITGSLLFLLIQAFSQVLNP